MGGGSAESLTNPFFRAFPEGYMSLFGGSLRDMTSPNKRQRVQARDAAGRLRKRRAQGLLGLKAHERVSFRGKDDWRGGGRKAETGGRRVRGADVKKSGGGAHPRARASRL